MHESEKIGVEKAQEFFVYNEILGSGKVKAPLKLNRKGLCIQSDRHTKVGLIFLILRLKNSARADIMAAVIRAAE